MRARALIWLSLCLSLSRSALADNVRFSHHITLHPIATLASVISFVPGEGESVEMVRAFLLLDGELLTIPLLSEAGTGSYRGTFPTPKATLSYRFQTVRKDGKAQMSQHFEVKPECTNVAYHGEDPIVKKALSVQQQRERLRVSRDLLRGFMRRMNP